MDTAKVGKKIKKLRELYKMTQKELGSFLNFSESYVSLVEKGTRNISVKDLEKIAKIFKVKYDYFFDKSTIETHFRTDSKNNETSDIDQDRVIRKFIKFANKKIDEENNLWKD